MDSCRGWAVSRRRNFSPGFDLCHAIAHRSLVGVGESLWLWLGFGYRFSWAAEICRSYLLLHISAAIKQYVFRIGSDLPTLAPAYLASPGRLRNPIRFDSQSQSKSKITSWGWGWLDVCASTKINVDAFSITTLAAYKFGVKRNRS